MLARGAFCRLAADVHKPHDLPRVSNLLRSHTVVHSGTSTPAARAFARVYRATLLGYRRSYATKSATTPTDKVKRDVKKAAAAKKPAQEKAAKAVKPTKGKATATRKPKRKTKKAKKPATKPKRKTKKLTPEEKEKLAIKELKAKALRPPVSKRAVSAWTVFLTENIKGTGADAQQVFKGTPEKFRSLTPAEREHYNHLARETSEARRSEHETWIRQHTPEQIRIANLARASLRRKLKNPKGSSKWSRLDDPRATPKPLMPWTRFVMERNSSGDFKNILLKERTQLISREWKALSAGEKKAYEDAYAAEKAALKV